MPAQATIIIVTHNRETLLRRTLDSLRESGFPANRCDVLILENGGCQGTLDLQREYADLKVTVELLPTPEKTAALNRALVIRPGRWHLYLDDDVRIDSQTLPQYLSAFDALIPNTCPPINDTVTTSWPGIHPSGQTCDTGWFFGGPTLVDCPCEPEAWLLPFLPASARGYSLEHDHRRSVSTITFLGFNWAAHADDLSRVGGYPAGVGPGTALGAGDETMMQWKLVQSGCRSRYLPDARVWHFVPQERCSPDWCLRRAAGGGATAAVFAAHYALNQSLGGVRAHLKNLKRVLRRIAWRRLMFVQTGGIFSVRWAFAWMSGFCRGYRAAVRANWLKIPILDETSTSHHSHS